MIEVRYLPELIEKALPQVDSRITNGISDFELALEVLIDAGVINTPKYWLERVEEVKYLDEMIIKLADRCRNILDRVVEAEAPSEDVVGRMLVANVIFNRVRGKIWPNTIYEVLHQKKQFAPISDGSYKRAVPTVLTRTGVDQALSGIDKSQGATYFRMTKGAAGSWHELNLKKLFEYGCHSFYTEKD